MSTRHGWYRIELSKSEEEQLRKWQQEHKQARVRKRAEAIRLVAAGWTQQSVEQWTGMCRKTVHNLVKKYSAQGLLSVDPSPSGKQGRFSPLRPHEPRLQEAFRKQPPQTVKEARQRIGELTGVELSLEAVREGLHRMGFRRRKQGLWPAKADPEVQQEFVKKTSLHV